MTFRTTLKSLIRRDQEDPKPRESAPDPQAHLGGSQTRRAILAGSLAAAVSLPALAAADPAAHPAGAHPDQALLDAEAELLRAVDARDAAKQASRDASSAFDRAFGSYPEELFLEGWERRLFAGIVRHPVIGQVPTQGVWREHCTNSADLVWTAEGLRRVIKGAVLVFGRGGQTPHLIRHWKGLLPLAETWDARRADLRLRFRCRELSEAYSAAEKAVSRASVQIHRIPATTVEGLAVHTRRLASTAWYDSNSAYTALLLSAAAITGVTLRQPDFDVSAWITAWERVGSRVEWFTDTEEWAFISPSLVGASDELKEQVRTLSYEKSSHDSVIRRWLEDRRPRVRPVG